MAIFTILYGNYYPPHGEFKLIFIGKFARRTWVNFTQQYGKNRQRCQQNTYYYAVWQLLLYFYREFPSKILSVYVVSYLHEGTGKVRKTCADTVISHLTESVLSLQSLKVSLPQSRSVFRCAGHKMAVTHRSTNHVPNAVNFHNQVFTHYIKYKKMSTKTNLKNSRLFATRLYKNERKVQIFKIWENRNLNFFKFTKNANCKFWKLEKNLIYKLFLRIW